MIKIVWINLLSLVFCTGSLTAQELLILDDVQIDGEVREPSVEIIASRILPLVEDFRMEKSFLKQARRPDAELVGLSDDLGKPVRMPAPELLLNRPRYVSKLKEAIPTADDSTKRIEE
jgi:hypothetical protein